eukprot:m.69962 g.69962  ORF g.69962 m.69962 type:complete len:948 (-) comp8293_c0_seq1:195-3038(-)
MFHHHHQLQQLLFQTLDEHQCDNDQQRVVSTTNTQHPLSSSSSSSMRRTKRTFGSLLKTYLEAIVANQDNPQSDIKVINKEVEEEVVLILVRHARELVFGTVMETNPCEGNEGNIDFDLVPRAVWLFEQTATMFPHTASLKYEQGMFLYSLGYFFDTLEQLSLALHIDPTHPLALESKENITNMLVERWHFRMLNDKSRNANYFHAIKKAISTIRNSRGVKSSNHANALDHDASPITVLDIGAGSGLLSMYAVACGADHVYACEMNTTMARMASSCIHENGQAMASKITVINKLSSDVEIGVDIPRRVDLIVTELVDAGLLGEHIIPTLADAKGRLLANEGMIIPSHADVYCVLVSSPLLQYQCSYTSGSKTLRLGDKYTCDTLSQIDHELLSNPMCIGHVKLSAFDESQDTNDTIISSLPLWKEGTAHAIVSWFTLYLLPDCIPQAGTRDLENESGSRRNTSETTSNVNMWGLQAKQELGDGINCVVCTDPSQGMACGWDQCVHFLPTFVDIREPLTTDIAFSYTRDQLVFSLSSHPSCEHGDLRDILQMDEIGEADVSCMNDTGYASFLMPDYLNQAHPETKTVMLCKGSGLFSVAFQNQRCEQFQEISSSGRDLVIVCEPEAEHVIRTCWEFFFSLPFDGSIVPCNMEGQDDAIIADSIMNGVIVACLQTNDVDHQLTRERGLISPTTSPTTSPTPSTFMNVHIVWEPIESSGEMRVGVLHALSLLTQHIPNEHIVSVCPSLVRVNTLPIHSNELWRRTHVDLDATGVDVSLFDIFSTHVFKDIVASHLPFDCLVEHPISATVWQLSDMDEGGDEGNDCVNITQDAGKEDRVESFVVPVMSLSENDEVSHNNNMCHGALVWFEFERQGQDGSRHLLSTFNAQQQSWSLERCDEYGVATHTLQSAHMCDFRPLHILEVEQLRVDINISKMRGVRVQLFISNPHLE